MNFFTRLLTDTAKASQFLKMGMLLPMLIPYVAVIEGRLRGKPGGDKKKSVMEAVNVTTDLLAKRGYITTDMNEGLDKIAAELIDVIVEVFNVTETFTHARDSEG